MTTPQEFHPSIVVLEIPNLNKREREREREMSEEGGKSRGFAAVVGGQQPSAPPPQYYYGTFQGVANYYPPPPHAVMGFPQPAPPAGSSAIPHPPYYSLGYQTVPVRLAGFFEGAITLPDVATHGLSCVQCICQVMLLLMGDPWESIAFLAVGLGLAGSLCALLISVSDREIVKLNSKKRQPTMLVVEIIHKSSGRPNGLNPFILLCVRADYREKPGLIACTLAAFLAMIAVSLGVTKATHSWAFLAMIAVSLGVTKATHSW
ncbi:unnamed protein product [Camellia sinensis]